MYPHEILDLHRLVRNQWLSPSELRKIQETKLLGLIQHSYRNVPYYTRLFDSVKLKPSDIHGIGDLMKIPASSKADLLSHPLADIMAQGITPDRCRVGTTSGTTGVPFKTYSMRKDSTMMNFGWVRTYMAHGMRLRDRAGVFAGWQLGAPRRPWYERLGIWRRKMLSSLDGPDVWVSELNKWKPHVITGYSMTLNLLASALKENPLHSIRPKLVFHSSGILDPRDRKNVEATFGCKMVDIYGSDEGGCIAWECAMCAGYHINVDLVAVETIGEDGQPVLPGQRGEIVITNLHSYAMPIIRYRQGDVGVLSPEEPSCGRGLPLLKSIEGRVDDYVVLPSGRKFSPHPFHWALLLVPGILQWRVIQEECDLLHVEIVAGPGFSSGGGAWMIESNLRKIVGDEMRIRVSQVDHIKKTHPHKFRSVISRLSDPRHPCG